MKIRDFFDPYFHLSFLFFAYFYKNNQHDEDLICITDL